MSRRWSMTAALVAATLSRMAFGVQEPAADLEPQFAVAVHPLLQTYCVDCHGADEPEAGLDLSAYASMAEVIRDSAHLDVLLERLKAEDMPPADASTQPSAEERGRAIAWFQSLRNLEASRNAGDPGIVLARRLSNAEYNHTIRDLTGVDLQPTREFPVDPANTAGFDNSGESLTMSPALLLKYLQAARFVADHLFLKPEGFAFAPHPMLAETDRDKYCVGQIIDFYHRWTTDYADYFEAAWRFKHRTGLGNSEATLEQIAADASADGKLSAKYLATVWSALEETDEEVGPLVKLQTMWRELPGPSDGAQSDADVRRGCRAMRDYVVKLRKKVEPRFPNVVAGQHRAASQPFLIWKNVQYATHRMTFDPAQLQVEGEVVPPAPDLAEVGADGDFGPGRTKLVKNNPGDPDLVVPAGERARYEAAFAKFCRVFPDKFYMEERGRNYFDTSQDRGRYLSAGFHSLMGYFRDDAPLYELMLDEAEQKQLDAMWFEMDYVAAATERMFIEFYAGGTRQSGSKARDPDGKIQSDTPVEGIVTSEATIRQLEEEMMVRANQQEEDDDDDARRRRRRERDDDKPEARFDELGKQAIKDYFNWINASIRKVEKARLDAEPSHLAALLKFAERAYRRPLTQTEQDDLVAFYRSARETDALNHEGAMRECIVAVLMAPDLCYRIDLAGSGSGIVPLSDYDLASRLSYFLWSSAPDEELLARAAVGDLHEPQVIAEQARRMLKDERVRALAVEFGGNWLDFRRFEVLNTVDRERFSAFDDELRSAMFEEPVRLLVDVFQRNRPVLDLIDAEDTFVNASLAEHYGMPAASADADEWVRVEDAGKYGRGGLLPMAVFLTKNSPGLRTSPVKRGNWVVKNVLGERIPPPPPGVPELPENEAESDLPLRELLARHRADPSCAACHARFDSFGLAFEGFDPVGEQRDKDLAGRPVDVTATFPDGSEGEGFEGLREHIRNRRQQDFIDNLGEKLLAFALGRSLMLSDEGLIEEMRSKLAEGEHRFNVMIESVVTSRQFLNKRGRDSTPGNGGSETGDTE